MKLMKNLPVIVNFLADRIVQVFDPYQTTVTKQFVEKLCLILQSMSIQSYEVSPPDIKNNLHLLLVCQNYSRLGTDIDDAIRQLKDIRLHQVCVIVIHTKEKHTLPITMPTDTLTEIKYGEYGLLVDFAFTPRDNIYKCDMNMKAKSKLEKFLKPHPQNRTETLQHNTVVPATIDDIVDKLDKLISEQTRTNEKLTSLDIRLTSIEMKLLKGTFTRRSSF